MQISDALLKPSVIRDRLTHLCYIGEGEQDPTGLMELAFNAVHGRSADYEENLPSAKKKVKYLAKLPLQSPLSPKRRKLVC